MSEKTAVDRACLGKQWSDPASGGLDFGQRSLSQVKKKGRDTGQAAASPKSTGLGWQVAREA